MNHNQALQVNPIETNGFFLEPLGPVRLLNHYHNFLFYTNITKIEINYRQLLANVIILEHKIHTDIIANNLYNHLQNKCNKIEELLEKINHRIHKRGLINVIGKGIKFITGNPDNDDLEIINQNLQALFTNQKNTIAKINSLTSFANHLTQKYNTNLNSLAQDINETRETLEKIIKMSDIHIIIQAHLYQASDFIETLKILERTISLSWNNIPNLEIINLSELLSIQQHLQEIYNSQQLFQLDYVHPFKILEFSQLISIGTEQTVTFLLKIPILESSAVQYSRIYPIPNKDNLILVPPGRYALTTNESQFWTNEECPTIENTMLCKKKSLLAHHCSMRNVEQCHFAKVINNYQTSQQLKNHQILVILDNELEILEDCHNRPNRHLIKTTSIVSSQCRLIIQDTTYEDSMPIFEIPVPKISTRVLNATFKVKFRPAHLNQLDDLQAELREIEATPVHLHPLAHMMHWTFTIIIAIFIIAIIFASIKFRTRLRDLLLKPRKILFVKKSDEPHELKELAATSPSDANEDVSA